MAPIYPPIIGQPPASDRLRFCHGDSGQTSIDATRPASRYPCAGVCYNGRPVSYPIAVAMTDSQPQAPTTTPAGVWRRLAAMVYDGMLLFGVLFVAAAIAAFIGGGMDTSAQVANEDVVHEIAPAMGGLAFQLYLLAIVVLFYCIFWRKNGQTLGMQAWRLRVQNADGEVPSWGQCLRRMAAGVPSLLLGGLGYWWIWVDRDRRAWHDRLSGTFVVVLPKKKK